MTTTNEAPKAKKAKGAKKSTGATTTWTLTEAAVAYLESLKAARKSEATISAYASDLDLATEILGAEMPIRAITIDDIARFNTSPQVVTTKSGRPKALPTVERTRRVLRLALCHAEREGVIEHAPFEPRKREPKPAEEAPAPKKTPKRAQKSTETTTEPEVGSEEWKKAQRELPIEKRESLGSDDAKVYPAAAEGDGPQIAYASSGEEVRA